MMTLLIALALAAAPATTLDVAAASSLQSSLEEVARAFEAKHADVDLRITYGSSGNFYAQLTRGAPFQVFLSADLEYPQRLVDAGACDAVFSYASGRLVVWSARGGPAPGLEALKAAKQVAIANPRHAPYGRAAAAAMRKLGVYDAVAPKLVLGENVAQAGQFAASGAADVAVIPLSVALAPALARAGSHWLVPDSAHDPVVHGGCIVKPRAAPASALRAFLEGDEARAIFAKHGLAPAPPAPPAASKK